MAMATGAEAVPMASDGVNATAAGDSSSARPVPLSEAVALGVPVALAMESEPGWAPVVTG